MKVKLRCIPKGKLFSTKMMVSTAMMIALTVVLFISPIGTIRLPIVSVTISHIPILIAALTLGLYPGLAVALAFGCTSLFLAVTSPTSVLDPFFVNPLVSILPRLLIPVTTYFAYRGLSALLKRFRSGNMISLAVSVAAGNLTNTFGVYTMLYLVYADDIFEKTGKPALSLIVTAISSTTLIKCVAVVLLTAPVVYGLKRALKFAG